VPTSPVCSCGYRTNTTDAATSEPGLCPECGRPLARRVEEPAANLPVAMLDPTEVNGHNGKPLSDALDFFVSPPSDIGELLSAFCSLKRSQKPMSWSTRLSMAIGFGVVAGGIPLALLVAIQLSGKESVPILLFFAASVVVFGLVLVLTLHVTRFLHTCTYVGTKGVARFVCSDDRHRLKRKEVFRFRDATDLRVGITNVFVNGGYSGTNFSFTWTDVGGRTRYSIAGQHRSRAGTPPANSLYHYCRAAELAWSNYLLPEARRQLDLSGHVTFKVNAGLKIRLGSRVIIIETAEKTLELSMEDMGDIRINSGTLTIKEKGAARGILSNRGIHNFQISQMANSQLFFFLLEKLVGISFG
jgi:hypothetical protein